MIFSFSFSVGSEVKRRTSENLLQIPSGRGEKKNEKEVGVIIVEEAGGEENELQLRHEREFFEKERSLPPVQLKVKAAIERTNPTRSIDHEMRESRWRSMSIMDLNLAKRRSGVSASNAEMAVSASVAGSASSASAVPLHTGAAASGGGGIGGGTSGQSYELIKSTQVSLNEKVFVPYLCTVTIMNRLDLTGL